MAATQTPEREETMRLYIYNENCLRKGQIAGQISDEEAATIDAIEDNAERAEVLRMLDDIPEGDCHYREGSESELVAEAKESRQDQEQLRCHPNAEAAESKFYFVR